MMSSLTLNVGFENVISLENLNTFKIDNKISKHGYYLFCQNYYYLLINGS